MKIIESMLTENPCYKSNRTIDVKGLMLHSVGCSQPSASVFVKKWNSSTCNNKCVHAFIDANTGTVYQCLPWCHRGWHAGSGKKGSANNTHIGVEMCEPAQIKYTGGSNFTFTEENRAAVQKAVKTAYDAAVELFANLCIELNLDPLGDGVIISHSEGSTRGIASNHGDPVHLWKGAGMSYTMDSFRADVAAMIDTRKAKEPKKKLYRVRKVPHDSKSQLGAFEVLDNAIALCEQHPGYTVYDWQFNPVFMVDDYPEVPFKVHNTETLTIYKSSDRNPSKVQKATAAPGVYTIVEIQNGSGLLKSYTKSRAGWLDLSKVKIM